MSEGQTGKDLTDAVAQHGGWAISSLMAGYLWIVKTATGRTIKQLDRIELKLDNFGQRISKLEGRMRSEEERI